MAAGRSATVKVVMPEGKGQQVYHIKPNDTLDLSALDLKNLRVDLLGSDIVLTDVAGGRSVVLAQMAIFMFSKDEAPHLMTAGGELDPQSLLAHVGKVWEFTAQDYMGITSMDKQDKDHQTKVQNGDLAEKVKVIEAETAAMQKPVYAEKAQEMQPVSADTKKFDELLDKVDNNKTGDGSYSLPPKVTIDKPEKHIDDTAGGGNGLTFTFDAMLLQPGLQKTVLNATTDQIYGGGAFETGVFDERNTAQFSQEIIDVSAGSKSSYVIYADNPTLFSDTTSTRALSLTPYLPDGFNPSLITIAGLPGTFTVAGATFSGGVWSVTNPVIGSDGTIKLLVTYPTTAPASFDLTIDFTATFDASTGVSKPATGSISYVLERSVEVKDVPTPGDGNYLDADGKLVWVMADNPNSNKILAGDKTVTVYGSVGHDEIYAGAGNDTLYGGGGDDILSAGSGDDFLQGGAGNDTLVGGDGTDVADYSDKTLGVDIDLAALNGIGQATAYVNGVAEDTLEGIENLTGGTGNDTLYGNAGNNVLDGGSGDDILMGRGGNDTLIGGLGNDTVSYAYAGNGVTITLSGGAATVAVASGDTDTLSGIENIIGTDYADTLTGDAAANTLSAGAGNDTIYISGGADVIDGGSGTDTLNMASAAAGVTLDLGTVDGGGYSTLTYGAVTQTVKGIESLVGSAYADALTGDGGDNTLSGGAGNDVISGGAGNDTIYGGTGADTLHGDGGTGDVLRFDDLATSVTVTLTGLGTGTANDGTSTDTFDGFEVVYLTAQADVLTESTAADVVYGLGGDDVFMAVAGDTANDTFDGGSGTDTINYTNASNAVTVNLAAGTATGNGNDTLVSIENVVGSSGDDTISGSTSNNTLDGAGGVNTLSYNYTSTAVVANFASVNGSGFATVTIGSDTDLVKNFQIITGGSGNDIFTAGGSGQTFNGGGGNDTFYGSLGADTFNGGANTDTVDYSRLSNAVNATLDASGNATVSFAGLGKTDTLTGIENLTGGSGNDTLNGNDSVNVINGGDGADTLYGYAGADTLNGGNGDDIIYGGNDNDTITGGAGNDTLYGEAGDDTFVGDLGDDIIDGGSGTNTMDYSAQTGALIITVGATNTLASGGAIGNDTITNVTRFLGGSAADVFNGGSGDDVFVGNGGYDRFYGSAGNDSINSDAVIYSSRSDGSANGINGGIIANMNTGIIQKDVNNDGVYESTDTWTGTIGDLTTTNQADTVYTNSNANSINGANGNDIFYTSRGSDTFVGGAGTDSLYYGANGSFTGLGGTINANLVLGTISKSIDNSSDSVSTVERIFAGTGNDSFTIDQAKLSAFTLIDGGSGTDTVTAVSGVYTVEAASFNTVFDNVEILDMRNATLSGADTFNVTGADVVGLSGTSRTLDLYIKSGFNLAISGGGYTIASDVTSGSTRTVTFTKAAESNVTLHVMTYA